MSQSYPNYTDAILGGQNPPPINAAVLGGDMGRKRELASDLGFCDELAYELIEKHDIFEFETVMVNSYGQIIERTQKSAFYYTENLGDNVTLDMVYVPAGSFMMDCIEAGIHNISVKSFYMAKYPITQAQYQAVMGETPSSFRYDSHCPVECVSFHDSINFCKRLSNITEKNYTLPTEIKWEYSFRGGTDTPIYCGETITTDLSNYDGVQYKYRNESNGVNLQRTTPVGKYPSNPWGLYDMHGNVMEWCLDNWNSNFITIPVNGGTSTNSINHYHHVLRGCSYKFTAWNLRTSNAVYISFESRYKDVGFRVCTD